MYMFHYLPLFDVSQILLFVHFFQWIMHRTLYLFTHMSFLQGSLRGVLELFTRVSLFHRPLCLLLYFLTNPGLLKWPMCHTMHFFSFLYGPLCIIQKMLLPHNIKLRRGLWHLSYLPLRYLTQYLTMLEVHSHIFSALDYYSYIKITILFLTLTWIYSHRVVMYLILFPLLQQVNKFLGNMLKDVAVPTENVQFGSKYW